MDFKCIYELTVRCTEHGCEEDLACYLITELDKDYVYTSEKKYSRLSLMNVEDIKVDRDEIILRIPFLIKEAAIVWVREAFVYIHDKGTRAMYEAVKEEWQKIMHPKYDTYWFTGGQKVEEWKKEMRAIAEKL